MENIHIIVTGEVQGVYYRKSTHAKALELDLSGYVENLSDGTVQIFATGSPTRINKLIEWCHIGSPMSRVLSVQATPIEKTFAGLFYINR